MAYRRRGGVYYVDILPSGYGYRVGPLSTRSRNKSVALQMEATVRELASTGRHPELDALREGRIRLPDLHTAKVTGRLQEFTRDVMYVSLSEAVRQFLGAHDDARYKTAMERLLAIAPSGARISWLGDPANIGSIVRRYREIGLAGGTERREMAGVRLLVRECLGKALATEIMLGVKLRPHGQGRTRWLTQGEIGRLRDQASEWWIIIGFAIATGLRRGEILSLLVKDIDFRAGTVVVPAGKSVKARRVVPLGGQILTSLQAWVAEEGLAEAERLFETITTHTLRLAWQSIRSAAGLDDVRFHDLRHTYAVHCAKAGMPLGELQQRLGHATITMTMRYAVYQPPVASVHYDRALSDMGLDDLSVPTLLPTPPPQTRSRPSLQRSPRSK
jgi:integrase